MQGWTKITFWKSYHMTFLSFRVRGWMAESLTTENHYIINTLGGTAVTQTCHQIEVLESFVREQMACLQVGRSKNE